MSEAPGVASSIVYRAKGILLRMRISGYIFSTGYIEASFPLIIVVEPGGFASAYKYTEAEKFESIIVEPTSKTESEMEATPIALLVLITYLEPGQADSVPL